MMRAVVGKKGDSPRLIGRTKGALNSELHAVCDGAGRPIIFLLTEGQMSATYCKTLYRQRHKVENMFAKLKGWRRISMRDDRCALHILQSICTAATVIFWLGQ